MKNQSRMIRAGGRLPGIVLWLFLAAFAVFGAESRVSPFYSLLLGNYGGNDVSDAMVIGKYWLTGSVPYRDLYAVGGPLYFLAQTLGWRLGGRTGIALLETVSLGIFLILLYRFLTRYLRRRYAALLTVIAAGIVAAFSSGGNSGSEWALVPVMAVLFLGVPAPGNRNETWTGSGWKRWFLLGLCVGTGLFVYAGSVGMLCGGLLFCLGCTWKRKGVRAAAGGLGMAAFGAAVIAAPVIIYFQAKSALGLMTEAAFLIPLRMWTKGFAANAEMLHKLVKCVLLLPPILVGVSQSRKTSRDDCRGLLWMSCGCAAILLGGETLWYRYLLAIPCLIAGVGMTVAYARRWKREAVAVCLVLTAGICIFPCKNYAAFLSNGIPDVMDEFFADVDSFKSRNPEGKIWVEDMDSTYYLAEDEKPMHPYFINQTELTEYSSAVRIAIQEYREEAPDILLLSQKGWSDQGIDGYVLVQVYLTDRGKNLCIYESTDE